MRRRRRGISGGSGVLGVGSALALISKAMPLVPTLSRQSGEREKGRGSRHPARGERPAREARRVEGAPRRGARRGRKAPRDLCMGGGRWPRMDGAG